jgi:hypothetical protein
MLKSQYIFVVLMIISTACGIAEAFETEKSQCGRHRHSRAPSVKLHTSATLKVWTSPNIVDSQLALN